MIDNKAIVKKYFLLAVEAETVDEGELAKLLNPQFKMWMNGKQLNYQQLVEMLQQFHKTSDKLELEVLHMVASENKVSTNHIVTIYKDSVKQATIEVFTLFVIENNQIIELKEMTYLYE